MGPKLPLLELPDKVYQQERKEKRALICSNFLLLRIHYCVSNVKEQMVDGVTIVNALQSQYVVHIT